MRAVSTTAVSWISITSSMPGMLAHQPGDAGNELGQRGLGRMGVDEQGRAAQLRGDRGDAVVAQRQAQLGGAAEPARQG